MQQLSICQYTRCYLRRMMMPLRGISVGYISMYACQIRHTFRHQLGLGSMHLSFIHPSMIHNPFTFLPSFTFFLLDQWGKVLLSLKRNSTVGMMPNLVSPNIFHFHHKDRDGTGCVPWSFGCLQNYLPKVIISQISGFMASWAMESHFLTAYAIE